MTQGVNLGVLLCNSEYYSFPIEKIPSVVTKDLVKYTFKGTLLDKCEDKDNDQISILRYKTDSGIDTYQLFNSDIKKIEAFDEHIETTSFIKI